MIKLAQKFDTWMKNRRPQKHIKDDNQALLVFLSDIDELEQPGFHQIKDYEALCQLGQILQNTYKYKISNPPCTSLDFGRIIINADSSSFGDLAPTIPQAVKFKLLAEKFHRWVQLRLNKQQTHSLAHVELLRLFLYTEGVLEHIPNYADFCQLSKTIKELYAYRIPTLPFPELTFYKAMLESNAVYLGAQPLEIPAHIAKQLLEEHCNA